MRVRQIVACTTQCSATLWCENKLAPSLICQFLRGGVGADDHYVAPPLLWLDSPRGFGNQNRAALCDTWILSHFRSFSESHIFCWHDVMVAFYVTLATQWEWRLQINRPRLNSFWAWCALPTTAYELVHLSSTALHSIVTCQVVSCECLKNCGHVPAWLWGQLKASVDNEFDLQYLLNVVISQSSKDLLIYL